MQSCSGASSVVCWLPLRCSWFFFRSGLVSIQSGFKRSRSFSLCFLDFFFLCWPFGRCWPVQMDVSTWGSFELGVAGALSVLSTFGLCNKYRRLGLACWGWLGLSNSSLTCAPELPLPEVLRSPLVPNSPWEGECVGKDWPNSLCFLGVWLLDESEGSGRFYEAKDKKQSDWEKGGCKLREPNKPTLAAFDKLLFRILSVAEIKTTPVTRLCCEFA